MPVKWLQMAGASGVMLGVSVAATAGCGPMIASEPRVKEAPVEVSVMLAEAQRLQRLRALVSRHAIQCNCPLCLGVKPTE